MKKTIRKIEILFMALICIFAMSGMPMQVYAGPADNSLETLTVAEGSLSPAFEGSRMYYTVQVGQDVSSVTVSAKTVNPAATIQSGVGTTTLKTDGDTKIDVVVQAENGNLATYHLTITKSATGAATDTTGTDTTTSTDTGNTPSDNNTGADNGTDTATPDDTVSAYTVSEDFAAEQIPADFTEAQVTYQGAEYRGAAFNNGNLSLLYMTDAAGNAGFYVVNGTDGSVCPYIRIDNGDKYLILMTPSAVTSFVPGEATTPIQVGDSTFEDAYATDTENIYTVYGMTNDGQEGWYNYNTSDGTFSEYQYSDSTEEDTDTTYLQNALNDKYTARKDRDLKIIAGLIVVIVILIFIIINLLLRGRRGYEEEDDDEIEEAVDIFEEEKRRKAKKKQKFVEDTGKVEKEPVKEKETSAVKDLPEKAELEEKEEADSAAQLPEEVAERLGETDFMEEFEEEPEFMSGRKKREKEKREKKEKKRRSKDIFDDDDEDNGIFASHDDFIEKESSDDDIEVMDLNDL